VVRVAATRSGRGAIPAIIRVSLRYDHVTDLVASQLQHDRATARDRGDT
jgi:hypothetical protein